jgi:hypothetical protein
MLTGHVISEVDAPTYDVLSKVENDVFCAGLVGTAECVTLQSSDLHVTYRALRQGL